MKTDQISTQHKTRNTQSDRYEKTNQTLYKISNAVSTTASLSELFCSIHHCLSEIIDTNNFFISLYHKDKDSLTFPYFVDSVDSQYPEILKVKQTGSMTAEVIRSGSPLFIKKDAIINFSNQGWASIPDCTVPQVWLGVPLQTGNTTIGAVVVQSYTDPDLYDQADVELLVSVAEQIAIGVEYKQNIEALSNSESHYRAIFENSPLGMIQFDSEGTITDCNPKFIEIMGADREKLIGFNTAKQSSPKMQESLKRALAGNLATYDDVYTSITGGKTAHLHVIFNPVKPLQNPTEVIATLEDISEQKRMEEEAKAAADRINIFFKSLNDAIFVHPLLEEGFAPFIEVNVHACTRYGYTRSEFLKLTVRDITIEADSSKHAKTTHRKRLQEQGHLIFETTHVKKSGEHFPVEINSNILEQHGQKVILAVVRDITDRKSASEEKTKLEQQLQQAQKMESVGRLAGGVAHDFNNMLSVILGNTELVLEKIDSNSSIYRDIEKIQKAAEHSADLTRQLLAFARKQTIKPKILDPNLVIGNMLDMLGRLIGEDIHLLWQPGFNIWSVHFDPSQIDQIISNLCINARDAISNVGQITIKTENSVIDSRYCLTRPGLSPGKCILISVQDTGCGMENDILMKIFEPFFTTKTTGKGTGLGLATVYGILKQNKGYIHAKSEPGKGSTFDIFLPKYEGQLMTSQEKMETENVSGGQGTVLLVEDEPAILSLITTMMKNQGYTILAASTPKEAIKLAEENHGDIDLILTDIIMPEMNGHDLTKKILSLYPNLKCIFMSGYTSEAIAHQDILEENVNFIKKPFSKKHLLTKVSQVLVQ